jgi:carbamoyl-phosphate synthase large subunit
VVGAGETSIPRTATLLVTGAGAPGIRGTLYALRENPDSMPLRIVGVDLKPDVVGRYLVDRFYQVPSPEDPAYLEAVLDICKNEGVEVVVPQTTREINVLSRSLETITRAGVRTMVSDYAAIEIANDKWRLLQKFQAMGLPVPDYSLARSEEELRGAAGRLGYPNRPVVVKPPFSNGMRGVRVLTEDAWDVQRFINEKPSGLEISLEDVVRILRRGAAWPDLLVMEYLPGPEYSVDVFIGEKTSVAIPRLRKTIRSGITFEAVLDLRKDLSDYALRAAREIGLRYAVGFQFKLDEHNIAKVLECNPRVQGTMVASLFSGVNVIWMGVKELLGEPPAEAVTACGDALFYRFWGGLGIRGTEVYEI